MNGEDSIRNYMVGIRGDRDLGRTWGVPMAPAGITERLELLSLQINKLQPAGDVQSITITGWRDFSRQFDPEGEGLRAAMVWPSGPPEQGVLARRTHGGPGGQRESAVGWERPGRLPGGGQGSTCFLRRKSQAAQGQTSLAGGRGRWREWPREAGAPTQSPDSVSS